MPNLQPVPAAIAGMSQNAIEMVRALEDFSLAHCPQVEIETSHVLHGGMYARTIMVPAGVVLTGALIKVATLFIVNGHATIFVEGGSMEVSGYAVIPAGAGRKQAGLAHTDTHFTMILPTDARTIEEAERAFTDEHEKMFSHHAPNHVVITGE